MNARTTSGRTFSYDEAGVGPTLVLVHGFPLSREMWEPQLAGLKDRFRVLTPDLPGFGGSSGFKGAPSVDGMADAVAEFLEAVNVREPLALGGLSMGGYVALAFARKYLGRLRALILADTRAEPDDEAGKANRDKTIAFAKEHTAADLIGQMMPKMLSGATQAHRPEVVAEVRRIASMQSIDGIVAALKALRDRPDAGPGIAAINVPTLVIVGAEDALTPPAMSQCLASRISGSLLVTIPGAGHLSNMEKPLEFTTAVAEFLRT
jgi:pimeloyl-ACP methyl ester carboxylesterase